MQRHIVVDHNQKGRKYDIKEEELVETRGEVKAIIKAPIYFYENCLNKKARLYLHLQNDGPGFCSVHRRSLL